MTSRLDKRRGHACAAIMMASILAAGGCATQAPTAKHSDWNPRPASAEEQQAIDAITRVGREIHRQDQFVWHAADAYGVARGDAPAPRDGGYVVTEHEGVVRVAFLAGTDDALRVLADVDMSHSSPTVALAPARAPDERERVQMRARATALAAAANVCGGPRNTVILPGADGTMDVYVLAASSDSNIVPVGGHARVAVSADGRTVLALEPYSKACLSFDTRQPGLRVLMTSIVLSDLPAPTHVYTSLTYPWELMLPSKTHLWKVADGRVTAIVNDAHDGTK
ncbi:hypothetical protein FHW12_002885 [Dokdonella fugitiva]|uniref:Lipoprotein n=1 Tax=Dokdonella fugitiva TaxID=328517 RepID=A0A839F3Q4_9GAMM|nr:hypothetical protein [Dokdonella fugitiva]MBA8888652.1 hypothetical protein [Dokdonella fugitiva]